MEISLDSFLLIISVLIFISLIIGKAGYKFGVPTLLLFLLIGLIAGTDVLNIIDFNSPVLAQNIGIISLNIILFSGGMDTNIKEIKPVVVPGLILATFGVLFTACITGLFIFFITHMRAFILVLVASLVNLIELITLLYQQIAWLPVDLNY